MLGKFEILPEGFTAILVNLSKALERISHELLLPKVYSHGFDKISLNFIYA